MSEPQQPPPAMTSAERAVAEALSRQRPAPTPAFRGALARRIAGLDPGYGHRPAGLWPRALPLIALGLLLVLAGALAAVGAL
ncbi:MAG: hypothetical protein ACRDKL_01955 [Solirubrobacteraceae bacterium]